MAIVSAIETLRNNPKGIRFNDLAAICDRFFGEPRQRGTSHRVYLPGRAIPGSTFRTNGAWQSHTRCVRSFEPLTN